MRPVVRAALFPATVAVPVPDAIIPRAPVPTQGFARHWFEEVGTCLNLRLPQLTGANTLEGITRRAGRFSLPTPHAPAPPGDAVLLPLTSGSRPSRMFSPKGYTKAAPESPADPNCRNYEIKKGSRSYLNHLYAFFGL